VHRDISPQNIFVTNTGLVKVLDFGIAKARSHEGRTQAGLVKGKFAYLAPEQACAQKVDRRADVWSVGVVLWEMLSGTRLFRSDNEAATLRATLHAEIPRVSTLRSEVDSDLDRILLRALQRHPNLRYQNASEMMGELQNFLSSTNQSADNSALATLIHQIFPDEILEQHRLVHELMQASESSLSETTPAPTSANATPAASESAILMEFSRIDGLLQELTKRHRVVLRTVLVTLFALVAVASFFVCFFLTRNNRPPNPSPLQNSATTLMPATSAVQPRPDLTNDNKLTNEEPMLPAVGTVAGDADTTSASCVSPAVTVQGLLSEAPHNWATQASTAAGESSASAPIVVRKPYKFKTRVSKRDYGI
jgi:serine/threonine protein kinase